MVVSALGWGLPALGPAGATLTVAIRGMLMVMAFPSVSILALAMLMAVVIPRDLITDRTPGLKGREVVGAEVGPTGSGREDDRTVHDHLLFYD